MRGNGTWQWPADTHLQVSGRVLRGFAAEAAIDSLFLLLREIESRLDTFRTATWPGALLSIATVAMVTKCLIGPTPYIGTF